ncbi:MAG: ABC transporter substrate-binding protein [Anaerolineae bacterium]|jgi:peptide/nickel transport system substrate-binding protein|nr:ABC transporter substrate-binding protein [Anaerolineae bacterium]
MKPRIFTMQSVFMFIVFLLMVLDVIVAQDSFYNEAPMLTEQVMTGDLPPVDERLPRNPLLVTPEENIGVYGGTWHMAMVGMDTVMPHRTIGYENLLRWDVHWNRYIPNVAQSFEANANSTQFTVKLREGMRWSDGHPFTSADILFWYEAVYQNDAISHIHPDIRVVGDILSVTAPDDYTVIFQFDKPNGLFLQRLASIVGGRITYMPRHYLSQFHPDYNPNLDQLVSEAGYEKWVDLFIFKAGFLSTGLPTLNAWVVTDAYDEAGNFGPIVRAVRNPYYWKIDTEFNQLPYIDYVEYQIVESKDDIFPLVVAGKIDMQDRNIATEATLPQNQASGGYRLYELFTSYSNYMAIAFNLTHADPIKRDLFQNKDFRVGLSYAINREAIIQATGLDVRPYQVAPLEGTPFYNEAMATQYLSYDVALANEYLDKTGYTQRDADGFRLYSDGQRISLTFLSAVPVPNSNYDIHLSHIQADWQAVGIEMKIETVARADAEIRWQNNDFDVTAWYGEGGYDAILAPRYYVPTDTIWSQQATLWVRWYLNPQDPLAMEPPASVKRVMDLYQQIQQTADFDQQNALMGQIIAIASEDFHLIGIHQMPETYGVVRTNFHNVPASMFFASNYLTPAPTNPCQYYIDPQSP